MAELKPWIGVPPHTSPPQLPGYRQVSHEKIDIGKLSVIGLILIPVWTVTLMASLALLGGRTSFETAVSLPALFLVITGTVAVILIHEVIHGAVAALLGAKPSFGIGPGFAYTTFLDPMSRTRYLLVGLSPLVVITATVLAIALIWPGLAGWMMFLGIVNASGAIGDLWMTWRILRAPRNALFYDLADGFAVLAPE